jgi:hypothetical protein
MAHPNFSRAVVRRRPLISALRRGAWISLLAGLVGLILPLIPAQAAVMGAAKAMPYGQAVQLSQQAANTVLERGGAESCLRGKLTKALLELSSSCEASAQHGSLCELADRAAVVTPMSLSFMDETARSILELSGAPVPAP